MTNPTNLTPSPTPLARSDLRRLSADALVITGSVVLAGLALGPAYGGWRWLLALAAGAVVGAIAGTVPVALRWPGVSTVAIAVLGYFLIGPAVATPSVAIAGVLPGPEALRLLGLGVVQSWKQLLTVTDPVGSGGALLVPALLIGLIASTAGCSVTARSRHPLCALLAPGVALIAAAAFGTSRTNLPLVSGTLLAVIALAWGAWRTGGIGSAGLDLRRPAATAVLLAGAVIGALVIAPRLAPAADRAALRDSVVPQFDPQVYPSPLSAFRRYVKADAKTDMITVDGLPKDGRLRLATMDAYNGQFYTVSTASGAFRSVGSQIRTQQSGTEVTLTVTVDNYSGVWLPDIGAMKGISFQGAHANADADSLRYAAPTGTAVVTTGLQSGDRYQLSAVVPATPDAQVLKTLGIGPAQVGPVERVPSALASAAATLTDGKDSVYDKVEAIRSGLADQGLLSHGATVPSPAGHGYDRLLRLMNDKKMVGDQEQFAPAMALMVLSLGIPARVVMGLVPQSYRGSGPVTLTGADMSAWVEVDFDQVGWVAFDPTPNESQVQQQAAPEQNAAPRQQILQPPPPPRVPQDLAASDVDQTQTDNAKKKADQSKEQVAAGVPWVVAAGVGVPVLLIVVPVLVILLLKRRRRARRRRAEATPRRFAGGWQQLLDGAVDLGAGVPGKLTRAETASVIDRHFSANTVTLARLADEHVFGPGEPDLAAVDAYWGQVDRALSGLRRSVSPWRRMRAALSTVSLRREGPD